LSSRLDAGVELIALNARPNAPPAVAGLVPPAAGLQIGAAVQPPPISQSACIYHMSLVSTVKIQRIQMK